MTKSAERILEVLYKVFKRIPLTEAERKMKIPPEVMREIESQIPPEIKALATAKVKAQTDLVFMTISRNWLQACVDELEAQAALLATGRKKGNQNAKFSKQKVVLARRDEIKRFIEADLGLLRNTELLYHIEGHLDAKKIEPVTAKVLRQDLKALGIVPKVKLTEVR